MAYMDYMDLCCLRKVIKSLTHILMVMGIVRFPNSWGHFSYDGFTLIPVWISNHTASKVWYVIACPFLNFKGATNEVWEWISNIILHFMMDVITYPCWGWT